MSTKYRPDQKRIRMDAKMIGEQRQCKMRLPP
jgi:hypothetical protein